MKLVSIILILIIQNTISQHYFLQHLSIPQDGKCAFGYGLNILIDGSVNCQSCQIFQNYFCTRCEITDYYVNCLETTLDLYQKQIPQQDQQKYGEFLIQLSYLDAKFCGEEVNNCLLEFSGENYQYYFLLNCQTSNGQELQPYGNIHLQFFQYKFCINCLEQNHHSYYDEQQNQYAYICIDPTCSYNYLQARQLLSYGKQTYQKCIYCETQLKEYKNQYGVAYDICELQCNENEKEIIQYDFQNNIEYPQCIQKVCDFGLNIKTISIGQKQFQYQKCKPNCQSYNTQEQNQDCDCPQNCIDCEISMPENKAICTKFKEIIPKGYFNDQEQKSKDLVIILICVGIFLLVLVIVIIIVIKYRKKLLQKKNKQKYYEQSIKDTPLPEIQTRKLFSSLKEEIQQLKSQFELIQTTSNKNYNLQKSQSTDMESLK